MLGLPWMSNVSSFSAHVLKTIALLIVLPVHLQACFVGTSLPLAHGGRTVVETAERKCQGSFSKTIISVYIFVWGRETATCWVKRQSTENYVTSCNCHKNSKCILFWGTWLQGACSGIALWVSHLLSRLLRRLFVRLGDNMKRKIERGWRMCSLGLCFTDTSDMLPQIFKGMSYSQVHSRPL